MLKKCLIAIALVAFLAATVQADTSQYKGDPWPWPFKWKKVEICSIPVYMEIGWWIEVKDCQDLEIILKQVPCNELHMKDTTDWPCYQGCEDVKIRANFEAELSLDLDKTKKGDDVIHKSKVGWNVPGWPEKLILGPTGGSWEEYEVCVELYDTDLWEIDASSAGVLEKVADLVIEVEPTADSKDWKLVPK